MTGPDLAARTRDLLAAYPRGDAGRCAELAVPGLVYVESGTGRRVEGLDRVLAGWRGWLRAFPDTVGTVVDVVAEGDLTLAAVVWFGTQTGPLPNGAERGYQRVELWDRVTLRWRDGRAVQECHAVGVLSLLASLLGSAPASGPPSARRSARSGAPSTRRSAPSGAPIRSARLPDPGRELRA